MHWGILPVQGESKIERSVVVRVSQGPAAQSVLSHTFVTRYWWNNVQVALSNITCPAIAFCDEIRCWACWDMVQNQPSDKSAAPSDKTAAQLDKSTAVR